MPVGCLDTIPSDPGWEKKENKGKQLQKMFDRMN
jgi:hypothetical protein